MLLSIKTDKEADVDMKYKLDCHMHTTAAGHAYSTIRDYVEQAKKIGLELIAITEHTPMMPGSTHVFFFHNMKVIPDVIDGIRVLKGAEANILNAQGEIDLEEEGLKGLDLVIASIHPPCFEGDDDVTDTYINAMKNPYIRIIGHPDDGRFIMDYKVIVEEAKKQKKILELNNSSLKPTSFRVNARENYLEMLKYCKELEVPIILGSDSHFYTALGNFEQAEALLEEVDFPEHLVMNTSVEKFLKFLGE